METKTPQQKVNLWGEVDTFCTNLVETYRDLVGTIQDVTDRDSLFTTLIQENLRLQEPHLGELFERTRLRFDSILYLRDCQTALVLQTVDRNRLALALKGTTEEIRHKFFLIMSNAAVIQLRESMEYMGQVLLSEVNKAQMEILTAIRALERSGAIRIGGGADEDYVC